MKNIKCITAVFAFVTLFTVGCKAQKEIKSSEAQSVNLFGKGDKLSNDWFTGNVFLKTLVARDNNNDFSIGNVTFEPGARSVWHTHPKGQVLLVTDGEGFYQIKGKPAQALKKGDVVVVPENTEHWHGASPNSTFVHIAITNYKGTESVVWLKPVTEEEYNNAAKK